MSILKRINYLNGYIMKIMVLGCACARASVYARARLRVLARVSIRALSRMHVCVYVRAFTFACVRICVCVCVRMCVCVRLRTRACVRRHYVHARVSKKPLAIINQKCRGAYGVSFHSRSLVY